MSLAEHGTGLRKTRPRADIDYAKNNQTKTPRRVGMLRRKGLELFSLQNYKRVLVSLASVRDINQRQVEFCLCIFALAVFR